MGEIRIVGPGKTRGYPYPVCKKRLVLHGSYSIKVGLSPFLLMKFYLILHFPSTVGQQPTCHFRNIEVESNDDRHLESFDALGPGR